MKHQIADGSLIERLRCNGELLCRPDYDPTYLCTRCEAAEALLAAEAENAYLKVLSEARRVDLLSISAAYEKLRNEIYNIINNKNND